MCVGRTKGVETQIVTFGVKIRVSVLFFVLSAPVPQKGRFFHYKGMSISEY